MIEIRGLNKTFEGGVALQDLTLSIAAGEIFGLLGPLGSGHSAVAKLLATLGEPSAGTAIIAGCDVTTAPERVRERIGYMPDVPGAYNDMRVGEYLEFFALAHRLGPEVGERMQRLLELAGLEDARMRYCEALDREQMLRLTLIRTVLHNPPVLLLDKPMSGLGPRERTQHRGLIQALHRFDGPPRTILLCSNILSDVAGLCDRIGMMSRGRLIAEGPADEIERRLTAARIIELEIEGDAAGARDLLLGQPAVSHADSHGGYVIFSLNEPAARPLDHMDLVRKAGFTIVGYREHELDFEILNPTTA